MKVYIYRSTKPKLKTSLLKGFADTTLFVYLGLIMKSYGARNGNVPRIVAYYAFYFDITLHDPTSHSFISSF